MNKHHQEARKSSGLLMYSMFKKIGFEVINLIYPPQCVHCGRVDTSFCTACTEQLSQEAIVTTLRNLPTNSVIVSTGSHTGILQSGVQALKYHNETNLAQVFAMRIAAAIQETRWTFDTIIPVPLHSSRIQERGYNQSQEIASVLSEVIRCPSNPHAIQRIRATRSQVDLNREERQNNMNNAFLGNSQEIYGSVILLIDDVLTTGATITACAQAAYDAGAKAVYGATVTTATSI